MNADDLVLVHYTSGTTGAPKVAMIDQQGAMYMIPYSMYSLDVKKEDMFWGFADPGWIYALFSVGTSVLIAGGSLLIYGGRMDAESWYRVMDKYEVKGTYAAHIYPRGIEFVSELPKTESGKIMRRELRKRFE